MSLVLIDQLVEELAADLCDRARRPARTAYHPESWELAGMENAGPPESTKRDWWRQHAREVITWVMERTSENPATTVAAPAEQAAPTAETGA